MRNVRINRLLAGTAMVLAIAAPSADLFAQSPSVRSLPPLPPMDQAPARRNVAQPLPPEQPPRARQQPSASQINEAPAARAQAEPPRPAEPVAAPVQSAAPEGSGIRNNTERPLAASDSQISEQLRAQANDKRLERKIARFPYVPADPARR